MMTYNDFYTIAEYGNENWKGNFSPREIANNAYDYKVEYNYSIEKGKATRTMIELCRLICEDMGLVFSDYYSENNNILTISNMDYILEKFVMYR